MLNLDLVRREQMREHARRLATLASFKAFDE